MLTTNQLKEIEVLQHVCEAKDQLKLKLNWDMLQNRETHEKNDFFCYENQELIGFLGIYGFGSKAELCGMVKPEFRRKGIIQKLLHEALVVCEDRKYREVLLNAPASSTTAKGFLKTVNCTYTTTEYQMKWYPRELASIPTITIRPSVSPEDLKAEIQLDVICFDFIEDEAVDYNKQIRRDEKQHFFIIEHEEKLVGKIRVSYENTEAWIYGFAIFPEFQGKGIGRRALKQVVLDAYKEGYDVYLDVEANNSNALKLYESCGFQTFQAQDYYTLI